MCTQKKTMTYDVIVIGGGPAGMLAAAESSKRGKNTVLIERNKLLGRKLRITGKGRCNITNICEVEDLISNVPSNSSFLYSSFYSFTNTATIDLFNSLGVQTKVERGGRVFPQSDSANQIADAMVNHMLSCGTKAITGVKVSSITLGKTSGFNVHSDDGTVLTGEKVIIACGGLSYPKTGSTGDGYKFARKLGHTVTPLEPSLIPLVTKEHWVNEVSGLSLKNVAIKIQNYNNRKVYSDFGEMLFTHFGVSGPIILSASAHLRDYSNEYKLYIDLKPALTYESLNLRIQRDFEKFSNKNFANSLSELLPKSLIDIVIQQSKIDRNKKVHQITKTEREALIETLKGLPLTITEARHIDEAIITSGGIKTTEINSSTMESKIVKGLYFAGEVIDVDAYTGGFNLQIAFSTGWLAGNSV